MRILSPSLAAKIKPGCKHSVYLLYGAEFLLVENSAAALREAHRKEGFGERVRFTVDRDLDWAELAAHGRALSLFGGRTLIELRMPGGRPGDAGAKTLIQFAEESPHTAHLVIICGALERAVQSGKWFKTVERHGLSVEHRPVTADKLPDWLGARMKELGMTCEREVPAVLAHYLEGNLLAADQEVRKLQILCAGRKVTVAEVEKLIADHSRFTVYQFVDACLLGKVNRALRILCNLRREGLQPVLVNWTLARELRGVLGVAADLERGRRRDDSLRAHRIWHSRVPLVDAVLRRLRPAQLRGIVARIARADRMIKGRQAFTFGRDVWGEFEIIALALCGIPPLESRRP